MARIEHDSVDFMRVANPVRPQDRVDDLAYVHGRHQRFVGVGENRKVGEETHAIDVELARPGLCAQSTTILAQGDIAINARVFRELIELRDVGEGNVIAILQMDDVPIGSDRTACNQQAAQRRKLFSGSRAFARKRHRSQRTPQVVGESGANLQSRRALA